jgi:heme/copper-type cytochrome/quinol oxidase subunit 3
MAVTRPRRPVQPRTPVISNTQIAIVAVIVSELMLFAGLIGGYLIFRLRSVEWPPEGLPRLPIALTAVNTLVLVGSVWPMRAALASMRANRVAEAGRAATQAALLGTLFVATQGVEWFRLVRHGLTIGSGGWGGAFYVLIGCHAVHVLVAIAFVSVVALLARRGRFDAKRHAPLEMATVYWYFVVALWVGLFGLVYLY